MTRDALAAFDPTLVRAVAREFERDPDALVALVRDHQESVRTLPGIDNLVYEWRRTLPVDPLVERRSDRYLLRIESAVWGEFTAALALGDDDARALRAVHARQFAESIRNDERGERPAGGPGARDPTRTDGREPIVLTRP